MASVEITNTIINVEKLRRQHLLHNKNTALAAIYGLVRNNKDELRQFFTSQCRMLNLVIVDDAFVALPSPGHCLPLFTGQHIPCLCWNELCRICEDVTFVQLEWSHTLPLQDASGSVLYDVYSQARRSSDNTTTLFNLTKVHQCPRGLQFIYFPAHLKGCVLSCETCLPNGMEHEIFIVVEGCVASHVFPYGVPVMIKDGLINLDISMAAEAHPSLEDLVLECIQCDVAFENAHMVKQCSRQRTWHYLNTLLDDINKQRIIFEYKLFVASERAYH